MAIYLISLHLVQHQTRSSTHWKLEPRLGKVIPVDTQEIPEDEEDDGTNNHFARVTSLYGQQNYNKKHELDDDEVDNNHHHHRHKHYYDQQHADRGDDEEESDPIMEILTTKLVDGQGRWSVNLHTQELRNMKRKKLSGSR